MNEGTRSGKSTIRLLGISAERPTNGLYLLPLLLLNGCYSLPHAIRSRNGKEYRTYNKINED
jgi:starvation-inducible outer membrane lipoprotein